MFPCCSPSPMPCELFSTPKDKESSKEGPELGDDAAVLSQSSPAASPASPRQHSPSTRCCTTGTGPGKVTSATSELCPVRPHPHPEPPHLCFPHPALPGLQDHSQDLGLGAALHGKAAWGKSPNKSLTLQPQKGGQDKWEPHQPAPDGQCCSSTKSSA